MSTHTGIEWTDATWSPLRVRVRTDAAAIARAKGYTSLVPIAEKMAGRLGPHCEHVSPGCENCYAETNNHRCLPANGTGLPYDRRSRELVEPFVDEKILLQPLSWKAPRKIFVENQSDVFAEWWTDQMLDRLFAVMALCPQHDFQILTKRPERMPEYLSDEDRAGDLMDAQIDMSDWNHSPQEVVRSVDRALRRMGKPENIGEHPFTGKDCIVHMPQIKCWPLPNVWLGTSVENQEQANKRIPLLLQTPAAVRFISAEPLLGPVRLDECAPYTLGGDESNPGVINAFNTLCFHPLTVRTSPVREGNSKGICWVICGGESGRNARPMHPDWARSLRDQCHAAGVPFFFKQWGEWGPYRKDQNTYGSANLVQTEAGYKKRCTHVDKGDGTHGYVQRVGKKAAGAMLDGREWREFPATGAVR